MLAWRGLARSRFLTIKPVLTRAFSCSGRLRWSEEDYVRARRWYDNLLDDPLPRIGEVSYARSSGPGGQNVNKYAHIILRQAQAHSHQGQLEGTASNLDV